MHNIIKYCALHRESGKISVQLERLKIYIGWRFAFIAFCLYLHFSKCNVRLSLKNCNVSHSNMPLQPVVTASSSYINAWLEPSDFMVLVFSCTSLWSTPYSLSAPHALTWIWDQSDQSEPKFRITKVYDVQKKRAFILLINHKSGTKKTHSSSRENHVSKTGSTDKWSDRIKRETPWAV